MKNGFQMVKRLMIIETRLQWDCYMNTSPLPPKTSNLFSTIVAVWPHLGGGSDPVTDSSIHSSDTVQRTSSSYLASHLTK